MNLIRSLIMVSVLSLFSSYAIGAVAQPQKNLSTRVVEIIEKFANSNCQLKNIILDQRIYMCVSNINNETEMLEIKEEWKNAAVSGFIISNHFLIENLNPGLSEQDYKSMFHKLAAVSLEQFKIYDSNVSYGKMNSSTRGYIFKSTEVMRVEFKQRDLTSVPIMEMDYKRGLQLFIGYIG